MFRTRNIVVAIFALILTFRVGFWFGESGAQLNFNNWKPALVSNKLPPPGNSAAKADFDKFWRVWNRVSELYVDKNSLDPQKMVDGAIAGMVSALGDPYTMYLSTEQNKQAKDELGGSFGGVGLELGYKDKRLAVMSPLEDTPADRAGIKAGDFILKIVDKERKIEKTTEGISIAEAVKNIRGEVGTKVTLSLFRESGEKPFDVELVREEIVVKSVELEFLEDGRGKIAWIQLHRFGDRTSSEWTDIVTKIKNEERDIDGIVLDVRNNPGGYLDGAVNYASEFLSEGKLVVSQQYGDGRKFDNKVTRNGRLLNMPLVVITNKGSASASEILAGALQDHRRAKVVGEKSFGKGSVQQPEDMSDGSGIHVTIAKWLRPAGEWIDKVGISPDIEVKWEEDQDSKDPMADPQLQKAIDTVVK